MVRDNPRITNPSPVRDLGLGAMDYERWAALHNELLRRGAEGSSRKMPSSPRTYWEAAGPPRRPPVVDFLKCAYVESPLLAERGALLHFVGDLAEPSTMVDVYVGCANEVPTGTFIRLHRLSKFRNGGNEGTLLNQNTMEASFITDYNDTPGVCALPFAWMPLEVILEAYLRLIDEGKVERLQMIGQITSWTNLTGPG
ncbi:uncharacterized protein APUU_60011A [Aspergillus puulaauensis]|uniref:Uncharacterized protein n=1 Tax=Aspergillus puulaauensis TaxID=1220207 RepID=A0A7R8ARJ2_9EURO|nr:uncharacterized protein APUU_60011A [Aspergillus puulaauensis]BCS26963.1 hypothetical protein APUU_60011A [Aspergillus puulaauensis]